MSLSKADYQKIRTLLHGAKKPLLIYDRDTDGFVSYLLLKRFQPHAIGVINKGGSRSVGKQYLDSIEANKPDIIFTLDMATVEQEFIDACSCPVVVIDHHELHLNLKGVLYFNPKMNDPLAYHPTSFICYLAVGGPLWLALIGIIGDWYVPSFIDEARREYPSLFEDKNTPGSIIYESRFGEIIKIFEYNLKGKVEDVHSACRLLEGISDPFELLEQKSAAAKRLYSRYSKVLREYKDIYNNATEFVREDSQLVFFTYVVSNYSLSGEVAEELSYRNPEKLVVVGREKEGFYYFSLRSKTHHVLNILKKSLAELNGNGGGHVQACGAFVAKEDVPKFCEAVEREIGIIQK
ncbi:DHH family phosphoesterase [Candidatus Woesearchaeota archaeon]|nr:DHH family phosphoesterase [Candidatus Woesearchaeota archaeon]